MDMLLNLRNWFCRKLAVVRNRLHRKGNWHEEARNVSQAAFRGKVQLPVSTAGQTPARSVFTHTKLSSTSSPGPDDVTGAEPQDQS